MDRAKSGVRAVVMAAGAALLLAACGSGAVTPPDGTEAAATDGGSTRESGSSNGGNGNAGNGSSNGGNGSSNGGNGSSNGGRNSYDWGLPPSDLSVTGNDGPMYGSLQRSCQEGEDYLNDAWRGFRSPRNVLLFAAGVELCRGDIEAGRAYFDHARTAYGLDGLEPEGRAECDVYKSVRSMLEQEPRSAFHCPGGVAPQYKRGPGGLDNPLTFDTDESAGPTETPEETTPGTTTTEPDESAGPTETPEETTPGTTTTEPDESARTTHTSRDTSTGRKESALNPSRPR